MFPSKGTELQITLKITYKICPQNTHFRVKQTYIQKVRGWANILHGKGNDKKLEQVYSHKTQWTLEKFILKGHYIKSINTKEATILINICALNMGAPRYIK